MKLRLVINVLVVLVCIFHMKISYVTNEYAFQGYLLAMIGWVVAGIHDWRNK